VALSFGAEKMKTTDGEDAMGVENEATDTEYADEEVLKSGFVKTVIEKSGTEAGGG
jgi:hypothetical protein